MKLVSSAKLRTSQVAMGNMVPYQKELSSMLGSLLRGSTNTMKEYSAVRKVRSVALVCFSSNSGLCGSFNNNAVREALAAVDDYASRGVKVTVFSVGKRMADAMSRAGYPSPEDYSGMSSRPSYSQAAALAEQLLAAFLAGRYDRVELIYNHYKSAGAQEIVRDSYLPFSMQVPEETAAGDYVPMPPDYIIEPGRDALIEELTPKVLKMKVYAVLLDTVAAEHAARVVAMQTATDNANSLLVTLTLEYNKSRQQNITSEILDLVSGSMQ